MAVSSFLPALLESNLQPNWLPLGPMLSDFSKLWWLISEMVAYPIRKRDNMLCKCAFCSLNRGATTDKFLRWQSIRNTCICHSPAFEVLTILQEEIKCFHWKKNLLYNYQKGWIIPSGMKEWARNAALPKQMIDQWDGCNCFFKNFIELGRRLFGLPNIKQRAFSALILWPPKGPQTQNPKSGSKITVLSCV